MEPKIRFKGFEGEWKETTLSEICIVNPKAELPHSFEYVDLESVLGTNLISHRTEYKETSPSRAQRVAEIGDIFFQSVRPYQRNNYLFTKSDANYVFSSGYVQLRTFEDNGFIFAIIQTDSFVDEVLCKCTGSSYPAISSKDLSHIPFRITKSKSEQQAIAAYFRTLDNKIQSTSKKLASLKKLKSASLVSMFPQNGESMPKVRFKGFEGEWDKQSASDLFLTIDERNRPELPVLSACQDVRGMIPRDKIGFNVSHDTSNEVTYKRVQPGQFVIHLRSFQGGFAHSSYDGIISPAYTVFDFKNKEQHDDYYWKIVFMSRSFIERLRLITYGIRDGRSISFNEFKELSFLFPSKEEQQAIASFFRSLDRKIALETARLEKLQQIKLACLDKMFV